MPTMGSDKVKKHFAFAYASSITRFTVLAGGRIGRGVRLIVMVTQTVGPRVFFVTPGDRTSQFAK
jgi:hypothetical protein